jgi:hypothetical protein
MNYSKLDKLAEIFFKRAQVLTPGSSEHGPATGGETITDRNVALAKISTWLKMITNAARPLGYGWSKPVAQNVFQAIVDQRDNPIEYAAVKMDMPDGKTAMGWAVLDVRDHYFDLMNPDEVQQALQLFL